MGLFRDNGKGNGNSYLVGVPYWGPHNEAYSILGFYIGVPLFRETTKLVIVGPSQVTLNPETPIC